MAFGIASGVKPEAGIYTAVVAGFLISALGGSRMQIGGPTGAFRRHRGRHHRATRAPRAPDDRVNGRCLAAPIAWSGFGKAVQFIPRPVTIGFTKALRC